jgi:lipoprotein-anchoring transpeptidase ErfK/SrfK
MNEETNAQAQALIRQAYQALRQGNRNEARQKAVEAARLSTNLEDPWLILAALASPQAAVAYLRKALEINPSSQRALQGMQWAIHSQPPAALTPPPTLTAVERTQPLPASPAAVQVPPAPAVQVQASPALPLHPALRPARLQPKKRSGGWLLAGAVMVVAILCLAVAAWAFWPSISTVFARNSAPRPAALLVKPSLTPSLTFTPTNTNTATATATFTATPTVTNTPLPTDTLTPSPTRKPAPTQTPRPAAAANIPREISGDQRWIDVDLARQRAYAYEGSTLIKSFVISSGVARYPTVKGQFHIYVKYKSALMTGPGYYLPNVPWVMYFYQSYGLHGTYWHNNFGTPMSHGCVNFKTEDAKWVYDFTSIGTLVNIH